MPARIFVVQDDQDICCVRPADQWSALAIERLEGGPTPFLPFRLADLTANCRGCWGPTRWTIEIPATGAERLSAKAPFQVEKELSWVAGCHSTCFGNEAIVFTPLPVQLLSRLHCL